MKASIFVDTSAWYALVDASDAHHPQAAAFLTRALANYRDMSTTNHVIGESYTLIRFRLGHAVASEFLRNVRQARRLSHIFVSEEMEQEAYKLLEQYPGQAFSFVDGTSCVAMKQHGITDCFAFDDGFIAAGFTVLPGGESK
ncbi:MAG: type II toxin-antitoxin system VapC family toxin [Chloroflexi bacterium]|nr:type II toxin-antitoxin system VapC family toxin [Chloroflexota bacterium]